MEQVAQYSPDIEEALRAAKIFFGNREAQLVYEVQWRADLDRRYLENLRNEQRDREHDAIIEARHAAKFSKMTENKRAYIARRLARRWNVDTEKANAVLKNKTDFDELNEISEKMEDCQSYEDFLKLLLNGEQTSD